MSSLTNRSTTHKIFGLLVIIGVMIPIYAWAQGSSAKDAQVEQRGVATKDRVEKKAQDKEKRETEKVEIDVHVERVTSDLSVRRVPEKEVELSIIQPPHKVVRTVKATTNGQGIAHFSLKPAKNQQAFASAIIHDNKVFSDSGIPLDEPGKATINIRNKRSTSRLDSVFSPRMITILELWEDYVIVTQVWNLASTSQVMVKPDSSTKKSGLRIPLPDDATGIRVVQPKEGVEVNETEIFYQQPIAPAGKRESGAPSLVVRFSLKHDNESELSFSQPLAFDVENASIVVPQTSTHKGMERLDVELDVPLCASSSDRSTMCFAEVRNQAEGVPMLKNQAVRVAGSGRTRAIPSEMKVTTTGWPSPIPVAKIVGGLAVALACIGLLALLLMERRNSFAGNKSDVRSQLIAARERIFEESVGLQRLLHEARIVESEYEVEMARLREELAVIERRLADIGEASGHNNHDTVRG